jgi:RimJ/RimL family protein N-acetyltransferase
MVRGPEIKTQRLLLRRWRKTDLKGFAAINADPIVMEYFPSVLTEAETARMIARFEGHFQDHGYGLWAVEHGASGELVGFAGLVVPTFEAHFTPAVEVGWRLGQAHWGNGYATEAARGAIRFAFEQAELDEIVSFASPENTRSTQVMERLGMTHKAADDFNLPSVPEDSPVKRQVLYRLSAARWAEVNQP